MRLRTGRTLAIAAFSLAAVPALAANLETNAPTATSASIPGKTLEERLIEAARDGRADEVGALIHDGSKVDARDDSYATPLILAARTGNVAIAETLLKAGADANVQEGVNGETALMYAARAGNTPLVHVLLGAKARVDLKDTVGRTALHLAARDGNVEVMELLLAAGADPSAQDFRFLGTPLHHAAGGGQADAVRCLLKHGCPVGLRDKNGDAPLHLAVIGNSNEVNVIKALLNAGADINETGVPAGETPLMWAARFSEHVAALQFVIQSRAELNKTDNLGWTALMWAKRSGNEEAAKILRQAGGEEHTNLSYAAANGDLAVVQSLLARQGAERPKQTELDTALGVGVENGHANVVKELLAHHANPNARLYEDWTPLLSTCRSGNADIARQLLAAGADVNLPRGDNGDTPLMYAAAYMPVEIVNELIAKGAAVNTVTEHGDTAAGWAAFGGKLENLKVLVDHGAEFNTHAGKLVGWPGRPLGAAVWGGHVDIVDFLLAHGGDINTADNHGKTLLMYAVEDNRFGATKLLIAHGANVFAEAKYDYNNTALKLAENTGKLEIAALLRIMEVTGGGSKNSRPRSAKLVHALTESTRAQVDNRAPDNAALLALIKEIVAAPDVGPVMKADARYLAVAADLETLRAPGGVSNDTARVALEADMSEFQRNHPDDVRVADVRQQWEGLQRRWLAIREARAERPMDLKFTAVDSTDVDVAKLRGKVILVDFWATWCGPCRGEIPHVVAAYNQLHTKGFEVVGISLDQNKEQLTNFTKQAGMAWPQYFDGKGWENEISSRYGIQSIPTAWLIDKKGFVRSTNAPVDTLVGQVKALLAE
jgi:ankyrin repeat protein/thiol-disulfide isomerase/thioredoxin